MRIALNLKLATLLVAIATLAACGKGLPGGKSLPGGDKIPGGVPGGLGGESGMVDPNSCGNYAGEAAGAKLKFFLEAVADLDARAKETVEVVKTSCKMMGTELGMAAGDLEGDTKAVCDKVWAAYN